MRGIELIRPEWPAPAPVRAAAATRRGGVSRAPYAALNLGARAGDDPAAVVENRARLARALGLPGEPHWLEQRHGARVLTLAPGTADRDADGAATATPGMVCAVLTADCLPVLLCDDAGSWVAAVHVGWRGLAADILAAAVAAYPGDPARLMAWRGPAIGAARYEVGADVRAALGEELAAAAWRPAARAGRGRLDLAAGTAWQLARLGVARCCGGGFCTYRDAARFYSHRRDGATGRQATLIWLAPEV